MSVNRKKTVGFALCIGLLLAVGAGPAAGQQAVRLSAETRNLLSRLQSMGHGYYPESEWDRVIDDIHAAIEQAEAAEDYGEMVSVSLILADVYSGMRGEHPRALELLDELKAYMADRAPDGMPRIYAALAEVQARRGDEAAIRALIEEFKTSPYYDPREYPAELGGGGGPNAPVTILRPAGPAEDSLTVTKMERSLREARLAVGRTFPDFEAVDMEGRPFRLGDLRGRPVLLDFWVRQWTPWMRRLPQIRDLYARHAGEGLAVVGVCIEPRPVGAEQFMAEYGMTWRQILDGAPVARAIGIGGEATMFLIDAEGRIIGRNLSNGDLTQAVGESLQAVRQ